MTRPSLSQTNPEPVPTGTSIKSRLRASRLVATFVMYTTDGVFAWNRSTVAFSSGATGEAEAKVLLETSSDVGTCSASKCQLTSPTKAVATAREAARLVTIFLTSPSLSTVPSSSSNFDDRGAMRRVRRPQLGGTGCDSINFVDSLARHVFFPAPLRVEIPFGLAHRGGAAGRVPPALDPEEALLRAVQLLFPCTVIPWVCLDKLARSPRISQLSWSWRPSSMSRASRCVLCEVSWPLPVAHGCPGG
mmetsp:Transcript_2709/g.6491  ORF Transcript_2709/g.6491 Transcript_2709/m.6491 type:complete len:247 (+) Transcript_2709:670-1410(+)